MREKRPTIDLILGSLVALLSMATAFAAYQATLADNRAGGLEVEAIKTLTESNTEFLRANQDVMLDFNAYDNFVVQGADNPDVADFYRDGFSQALEDSMARADGPFDDAYYDDIFVEADDLYTAALDLFDEAGAAGALADQLQMVMLILGVGLSLTAFASIGEGKGRVARLFITIGWITLLFGIVRLLWVLLLGS